MGHLGRTDFFDKKGTTADVIALARPERGERGTAVEIESKKLRGKEMMGNSLREIAREENGESIRLERVAICGERRCVESLCRSYKLRPVKLVRALRFRR